MKIDKIWRLDFINPKIKKFWQNYHLFFWNRQPKSETGKNSKESTVKLGFNKHKRTASAEFVRYNRVDLCSKPGVGNSFGFAGHIRDKLGICGPIYVHVNRF